MTPCPDLERDLTLTQPRDKTAHIVMAELGTQALISAGFSERISSTQTHRAAYDEFRESFWAIQAKEDAPAAVVRPASVTELSEVVKVLGDVNVKNGFTTPFAIRSGGHTPWPGSASIAGGVAVDLRSLRRVEVTDGGVVIGSGSLWEDVYGTLDPLNLTVPGARVARCGVTGLAMGGKSASNRPTSSAFELMRPQAAYRTTRHVLAGSVIVCSTLRWSWRTAKWSTRISTTTRTSSKLSRVAATTSESSRP